MGHESEAGGDFCEVGIIEERELGFQIEFKPGKRTPDDIVVEVGKVAVELRVFKEGIEVCIDAKPIVGCSVSITHNPISGAETKGLPVFQFVDCGEASNSSRAGPGSR